VTHWQTVQTTSTVEQTVDTLRAELARRDVTVFAVYDHAANAREAGLSLADEVVIVFGSPAVGTALIQENPDVGYELPLRILVRDDGGVTHVAYRDPAALVDDYGLSGSRTTVAKLSSLLGALAEAARG
jgi:uncharacterized protein (DUF302 family)